MNNRTKKIWFPAKKYGWGWGFPCAWQGWIVLICFVILIMGIPFLFPPHKSPLLFYMAITLASCLLILICYIKGEKPKWQWGNND